MIKQWAFLILSSLLLYACSNNNNSTPKLPAGSDTATAKKQRFFPVTNFLLGDLASIKQKGLNPVKVTVQQGKRDSVWLKLEQLEPEMSEFLHPVIDSTNMIMLFKESSFQDQTINTFTFTYEPWATLPDSINLVRWDVYIDADQQTVKRIYMVKAIKEHNQSKTLQLTWEAGHYCKMVTLNADNNAVEKEVSIVWDF